MNPSKASTKPVYKPPSLQLASSQILHNPFYFQHNRHPPPQKSETL